MFKRKLHGVATKCVERWAHRTLLGACAKWCKQLRQCRVASIGAARWLQKSARVAWNRWRTQMHKAHHMRKMTCKVCQRWRRHAMCSAWMKWYEQHRQRVRIDCIKSRCAKHLKHIIPSMSASFDSWKYNLLERKRMVHVVSKLARRRQHFILSVWYATWTANVLESKRIARVSGKIVKRWASISITIPFVSWAVEVQQRKCIKLAASKILLRLLHLNLASPLQAWLDYKCEQKRWKRAGNLVFNRSRSRDFACAFKVWKNMHNEFISNIVKVGKILVRWHNMTATSLLAAWRQLAKESHRLNRLAASTVRRWANVVLAPVFASWVKVRIMSRVTRSSVIQWLQFMEHVQSSLAQDCFQVWARKVRQGAAKVVMNNKLLIAWKRLVLCTALSRKERKAAVRMFDRVSYRPLLMAFERWLHLYDIRRMQCSEISRWFRRSFTRKTLTSAYAMWYERTTWQLRQCRVVWRVAAKWLHKSMSVVWSTWRTRVHEAHHTHVVTFKVCQRWRRQAMRSAWITWYEQRRAHRLKERIVQHWIDREISWIFTGWKHQTEGRRIMTRQALSLACRWICLCKKVSFESWKNKMLDKRRLWQAARKVVRRWQKSTISREFARWIEHGREHMCSTKIAKQAAARCLLMAWSLWYESMSVKKRLQTAACKITGRWTLLQVARPWYAWCCRTTDQKHLKRKARQILQRWSKLDVGPFFETWTEACLTYLQVQNCTSKALAWLRHICISSAFHRWIGYVTKNHNTSAILNKVCSRWQHRALVRGFHAFVDCFAHHRRVRFQIHDAQVHLSSDCKEQSFQRWLDQLDLWRALCVEKHSASKRWAKQLVELREKCKVLVCSWIEKGMLCFLSAIYDEWVGIVSQNRAERQRCKNIICHFANAVLRITFQIWVGYTHTFRQIESTQRKNARLPRITGVAAMVLAFLIQDCLSTKFSRWVINASECVRSRNEDSHHAMILLHSNRLLQALLLWKLGHQHHLDTQLLSDRLVYMALDLQRRWKTLALSGRFREWATISRTKHLQSAAKHLEQHFVSSIFDAWKHHHTIPKEQRCTETHPTEANPPENKIAQPKSEALIPLCSGSAFLSPPGPDTWWSNMQRNMSFREMRFAHTSDRGHEGYESAHFGQHTSRYSTSPPRFGQLRFRETTL